MRRILVIFLLGISMIVGTGCGMEKNEVKEVPDNKQMTEPELSVYMHETGETKQIMLETYIEGVVAGEMKNDWKLEALAAQAIIARTFTLQAYERGHLTSQGTNASTDIKEFQAYNADAVNDQVREAVKMTRGEIATYNEVPIMGWFHASAGGQTALAKEGLAYKYEEPPFIKSVKSPDDLAPDDVKNWTAKFTLPEVMEALGQLGEEVNTISSVAIGSKGSSGRAVTIVFNGSNEVSAPSLRVALGSTKLKSMLLDSIELTDNEMVFKGKGYGHGVGMSQWGAYKMAMDGNSPEEIVRYYFKNVKIEKRWE